MDPIRLSWDDAPRHILDAAGDLPGVAVIGVTGPVGSGKSTLARRLGGLVVSTDDYLPDYDGLDPAERDLPERADLDHLAHDLADLAAGRAARVPVWSHHEHRRTGEREIGPAPLVVVEGLFALHERVLDRVGVGVFVEASPATRWARWEAIELGGERGWGVEHARRHFEHIAEPTFGRHADAYRAAARFIVMNEGEDLIA